MRNLNLGTGTLDAVLVTIVVTGLAAIVTGVLPPHAQAGAMRVNVPVYCDETLPPVPELPREALAAGADPFVVARALQAHVAALEETVEQLQDALQACTAPAEHSPP